MALRTRDSARASIAQPDGRGVALIDPGQAAFSRAEEIFQLDQMISDQVREAASGKVARLAIGMSDGISKLVLHALIRPVLTTPSARLVCRDGEFGDLLAELTLHRLDLVLSGHPAPRNPNLRLTTERLAESPVAWYGSSVHAFGADVDQFPKSLNRLPVLLPTCHSALRATLDRWFEANGLQPRLVGEFEDIALLAVVAARGLGVFPVSRLGADDAGWMRELKPLGRCDDVTEEIHAIRSRRRQHHSLVLQIMDAATFIRTATIALAAALAFGAVATQDKPVALKLASWVPAQHALNQVLVAWAEDIKKASGGTITFTMYPSEQLGKAFDHYDMARDGISDLSYVNSGYQLGRFPVMAGASLPFLFANAKGGSAAIDSWYQAYTAKEMKDVKFCFAFVHDPGTFHSKKKLLSPTDVKGLKARPVTCTIAQMVTLLGGNTVQASAPEARDALERGWPKPSCSRGGR